MPLVITTTDNLKVFEMVVQFNIRQSHDTDIDVMCVVDSYISQRLTSGATAAKIVTVKLLAGSLILLAIALALGK